MRKITYLNLNREKKMKRNDFMSKIDQKPPLETIKENLKRKN